MKCCLILFLPLEYNTYIYILELFKLSYYRKKKIIRVWAFPVFEINYKIVSFKAGRKKSYFKHYKHFINIKKS